MEKFAAVNHADAGAFDDLPDFLQPAMPTRCPHHQIHTQRRDTANVLDHRVRSGEVNANIYALEFLRRDALAVLLTSISITRRTSKPRCGASCASVLPIFP